MREWKAALLRLDPGDDGLARLARLYGRVVAPATLLLALILCWPAADGRHDLAGAAFGHDLSQIWVAGRTALAGRAAEVYDIALHQRRLVETFGPGAAMFVWHYPPVFLTVAALLACLPYGAAVLAWALASLSLIASALRTALCGWRFVLVGLALPPVVTCLSYGQNSLLTASLLTFGLARVERRPLLAGAFFGLTCFKPQLAAVAPLLMLASGRWRVAAASAATAAAMMAASLALFGPGVWAAFFASLADTNIVIFRDAWGSQALNASAFGAVRLLGGSLAWAWAMQAGVAALALGVTLRLWRAPCCPALRRAAVLATVPLVSPYVPVYDLAVLVPAGAFFAVGARATGGLTAGQRGLIVCLVALSLDPRGLTAATHVPCGFLLAAGVHGLIVLHAWRRAAATAGRAWTTDVQRSPA